MNSQEAETSAPVARSRRGNLFLNRKLWGILLALGLIGVVAIKAYRLGLNDAPRLVFPEEVVFAQANDDVIDGGVLYTPSPKLKKQVAVIWIHGWGVNFYSPSYVWIGRALAERGYACITGNTRMHDLGNVELYRGDKRIRGGGYWGIASEEVRDIAAWIDLAESRGYKHVVLVGHSAGWAAVRLYQSQIQDSRVVGIVCASGGVKAGGTTSSDSDELRQAKADLAKGEGDALHRIPKKDFPSYISADTYLDIVNSPPDQRDFFGTEAGTTHPGVSKIRCPLLAFYGTFSDVGDEKELALLKESIKKQPTGPSRVDTLLINHSDHMYLGQEQQVADVISKWVDSIAVSKS